MKEEEAVELLRKHIPEPITFRIVFEHSKAVEELAIRIAKNIPEVDIEFLKNACILHDIGRYGCRKEKLPTYKHGLIGADILRKEGHEKLALAAERHLGAGISRQEISEQKLDLPPKDFVPQTKEEKILADADNLIANNREITIEDAYERYRKELGEKVAEKIRKLHQEVEAMKR